MSLDRLSVSFKLALGLGLPGLLQVSAARPCGPSLFPAPACAQLCLISLSLRFFSFLFLLSFPGHHILRFICQVMPPQPPENSLPLAKLPHCGQLAPLGHFTILQTEKTLESEALWFLIWKSWATVRRCPLPQVF